MEDPNSDGFIVAKAAIDRLLLNNYSEFNELKTTLKKYINECLWSVLPLSINPCSPGQGALAIETRIKDNKLNEILNDINFSKDYSNVIKERNILKNYGTFVIFGVLAGTYMAALMNTQKLLLFFSIAVFFFWSLSFTIK